MMFKNSPLTRLTGPAPLAADPGADRPRVASPARRRAITLTEVLISMGILTLGLLGVAALFPVGGFYMQKAEIADRGSAIAQQAMNDLLTKGMLNPNNWQALVRTPALANVEGPLNSYTRPVGRAMAQEMLLGPYTNHSPAERPQYLARRFGSAFIIDPRGIAGASFTGATLFHRLVSAFPADAGNLDDTYSNYPGWDTWSPEDDLRWPVQRVTFHQPDPTSPTGGSRMVAELAERLFSASDDISIDMPERDDRPAIQTWDTATIGGNTMPLARQWVGDYSWLASVVPTTSAAQAALGRNPETHEYEVSVVVFHKRPIPSTSPQGTSEVRDAALALQAQEKVFRARIISKGPNGGEVLLQAAYGAGTADQFQQLKVGEWMALCGPHPASSATDPRFVLKWYQVTAIDGVDKRLDWDGRITTSTSEPFRRLVVLRGPEWPWRWSNDTGDLSHYLCAAVMPGAVAVHTKTIRLEGPHGSASGGGAGSGIAAGATGAPVDPPMWWFP